MVGCHFKSIRLITSYYKDDLMITSNFVTNSLITKHNTCLRGCIMHHATTTHLHKDSFSYSYEYVKELQYII